MIPGWAEDFLSLGAQLDLMLDSEEGRKLFPPNGDPYKSVPFWIEIDSLGENTAIRFCLPDENINLKGQLILICKSYNGLRAQIEMPLNPIFKNYESIIGRHSVYCHSFQTEVPLAYVGLTKKPWYERFSQHLAAANSGSPYFFHKALLKHRNIPMMHKVFVGDLDYECAMKLEEELVEKLSLYPLGLNMIPGGAAGLKYLQKMGFNFRNEVERDSIIEQIIKKDVHNGRPNPLCAARWASDQNFVERVICGHSGRLTAEQVRTVRLLASFDKGKEEISQLISAKNVRQVSRLLGSKTYNRIK